MTVPGKGHQVAGIGLLLGVGTTEVAFDVPQPVHGLSLHKLQHTKKERRARRSAAKSGTAAHQQTYKQGSLFKMLTTKKLTTTQSRLSVRWGGGLKDEDKVCWDPNAFGQELSYKGDPLGMILSDAECHSEPKCETFWDLFPVFDYAERALPNCDDNWQRVGNNDWYFDRFKYDRDGNRNEYTTCILRQSQMPVQRDCSIQACGDQYLADPDESLLSSEILYLCCVLVPPPLVGPCKEQRANQYKCIDRVVCESSSDEHAGLRRENNMHGRS